VGCLIFLGLLVVLPLLAAAAALGLILTGAIVVAYAGIVCFVALVELAKWAAKQR